MPSASSKSEKPASTEAVDPLKQAIVIVGHKIRNLEKRKVKLDSYKDSIKSLTKEQVEAVAKYDEVVQQLELSKEYVKQFTVISIESDKTKKKQAKKDAQDKHAADINKIKQVLLIQDVLQHMMIRNIRQDFLAGLNGAVQLTEADLKTLDDLFVEISPKRSFSDDGTPIHNDNFQKAAEVIMTVIEGKTKEVAGSTGAKLRDLVTSISSCGYFEKAPVKENVPIVKSADLSQVGEKEFHENTEILSNVIVPTQNSTDGSGPPVQNTAPMQPIMPGAPIVTGAQPLMPPSQHPILPPNVSNIVPTPVSQVESSFFNAQGFKPPVPPTVPPSNQSARQISDVIQSVAGKFSFLQESELEMTELNSVVLSGNSSMGGAQLPTGTPAIPSQTFTNQNFNGQPGNGPSFPPNYNPQPTAFQTFVPAFPGFVPPTASPFENSNANPTPGNSTTLAPVHNQGNLSVTTSSAINGTNNKCSNIPNPIPIAANRNSNLDFSQSQQHLTSNYSNQSKQTIPQPTVVQPTFPHANIPVSAIEIQKIEDNQSKQNITQPAMVQPTFPHGNIPVSAIEIKKIEDTVRVENERKELQESDKTDWSQPEGTPWTDDWAETSDWNTMTQNNPPEASVNATKFSSTKTSRNSGGIPRNVNGFQGNRGRTNRPGGYRDTQGNQGSGTSNYYQNQNGYQSRNERNNDYSVSKSTDFRDNTFKERGDFSNRERDNYGGGFKRGPSNRGLNARMPMDRGDKSQMHAPRGNSGGSRVVPRNANNRPTGGRSGSGFQRQPNPVNTATLAK